MAYRVAIVDDSVTDARFVEGILTDWAGEKQTAIQAEVFASAESFLFRYAEDKEHPENSTELGGVGLRVES